MSAVANAGEVGVESPVLVMSLGGRGRDDFTVSGKFHVHRITPFVNPKLDFAFGVVSSDLLAQSVPSKAWSHAFPHAPFLGASADSMVAMLNHKLLQHQEGDENQLQKRRRDDDDDDDSESSEPVVQALSSLIGGSLVKRKLASGRTLAKAQSYISPNTRVAASALDGSVPWVLAGHVWRLSRPLDVQEMCNGQQCMPGRYRLVMTALRCVPVPLQEAQIEDIDWDDVLPKLNNAVRVLRAVGLRSLPPTEASASPLQAVGRDAIARMLSYSSSDIWSNAARRAYDYQCDALVPRPRGRPAPTFHPEKMDGGEHAYSLPQLQDLAFDLGTVTVQENGLAHIDRCPRWNVETKISRGMTDSFKEFGQRNIHFEWSAQLQLVSEYEVTRAHMTPLSTTRAPRDEDDLPAPVRAKRRGPVPRPAAAASQITVPQSTKLAALHPGFFWCDDNELCHALVTRSNVRAESALGVLPHYLDVRTQNLCDTRSCIATSCMTPIATDSVRINYELEVETLPEQETRGALTKYGVFTWVKSPSVSCGFYEHVAQDAVFDILRSIAHERFEPVELPSEQTMLEISQILLLQHISTEQMLQSISAQGASSETPAPMEPLLQEALSDWRGTVNRLMRVDASSPAAAGACVVVEKDGSACACVVEKDGSASVVEEDGSACVVEEDGSVARDSDGRVAKLLDVQANYLTLLQVIGVTRGDSDPDEAEEDRRLRALLHGFLAIKYARMMETDAAALHGYPVSATENPRARARFVAIVRSVR